MRATPPTSRTSWWRPRRRSFSASRRAPPKWRTGTS